MLQQLRINNYAIIEKVEVNFQRQLNIITGETGAGKSILIGALSILLGDRFEKTALYDESKKCIIEAEFNVENLNLKSFFEDNELDYYKNCTLRREINPNNRSRSFINDTPVTLKTIRVLTAQLIDIHSQHDILDLKSNAYQLDIIDREAGLGDDLIQYQTQFEALKTAEKNLTHLKEEKENSLRESDYLHFILHELENAQLKAGEEESLTEELKQLENAEEIELNLGAAYHQLDTSPSAISLIEQTIQDLNKIVSYIPELDDLINRLNSSNIELKDIAAEIENCKDNYEHNPNKLAIVQERLNIIHHLQRKHQVKTIDELLVKESQIAQQVETFANIDESIELCQRNIKQLKESLKTLAFDLRLKRKQTIQLLEEAINKILPEIGMPFVLFKIALTALDIDQIHQKGLDQIDFLLSPDKGNKYGPINKIASGGELSRIMLCLKSILANSSAVPTLIFDEIDTGISGDIASKVANLMQNIAKQHQIISITHLPQIAAKGNHHLFVRKSMIEGKTQTQVSVLNDKHRIKEIATMLSGKEPSSTALKTAKELIGN